jgi:hypothetical protein
MLMDVHKMQRMAMALTFLEPYHKDADDIFNYIIWITADQTWVPFVNAETKEQSKQWMHTHSTNKPKTFMSSRKLMATVFWDRKGVLKVKFMQQWPTVPSEVYCKTLK